MARARAAQASKAVGFGIADSSWPGLSGPQARVLTRPNIFLGLLLNEIRWGQVPFLVELGKGIYF
jgi:hypothetical protein